MRSHLGVLKQAIKDKQKLFFLFEDDIKFKDGFWETLEFALSELPKNFDALHLGGFEGQRGELAGHGIIRVKEIFGGYAILFNAKKLKPIIKLLEQDEMQCDMYYTQHQKQGNWYRTLYNIVFHNAGISTIQGRFVDYPKLRT